MSSLGLTLNGETIFAPTESGGAPRGAAMGEVQTWAMEIESTINAVVSGVAPIQGGWDASGGSFPGAGDLSKGDAWRATAAGTVDDVVFRAGDLIVALVDDASTSTYAANWIRVPAPSDITVALTQAEYDALTPATGTLYVITD